MSAQRLRIDICDVSPLTPDSQIGRVLTLYRALRRHQSCLREYIEYTHYIIYTEDWLGPQSLLGSLSSFTFASQLIAASVIFYSKKLATDNSHSHSIATMATVCEPIVTLHCATPIPFIPKTHGEWATSYRSHAQLRNRTRILSSCARSGYILGQIHNIL